MQFHEKNFSSNERFHKKFWQRPKNYKNKQIQFHINFPFLFQDVSVLRDIVENVSPTIPTDWDIEEEDEDEKMQRIKQEIKAKIVGGLNILCVWDCANIWIKISEVLAFLVFDPFTELFITLCIVVNVVFMALDHYLIEFDPIGCQAERKDCGM